jgi:hypothetical protein
MASLTDRLNPDRRTTDVAPIAERRDGSERRLPEWVRRAQEGRLSGKDLTGRAA